MRLVVIFIVLICLLLIFLIVGERISLNLFRQGTANITKTLLQDAPLSDSVRILSVNRAMISAFRKKRLEKNELRALDALIDSAMTDSVISGEEREEILQFMEMLAVE